MTLAFRSPSRSLPVIIGIVCDLRPDPPVSVSFSSAQSHIGVKLNSPVFETSMMELVGHVTSLTNLKDFVQVELTVTEAGVKNTHLLQMSYLETETARRMLEESWERETELTLHCDSSGKISRVFSKVTGTVGKMTNKSKWVEIQIITTTVYGDEETLQLEMSYFKSEDARKIFEDSWVNNRPCIVQYDDKNKIYKTFAIAVGYVRKMTESADHTLLEFNRLLEIGTESDETWFIKLPKCMESEQNLLENCFKRNKLTKVVYDEDEMVVSAEYVNL